MLLERMVMEKLVGIVYHLEVGGGLFDGNANVR